MKTIDTMIDCILDSYENYGGINFRRGLECLWWYFKHWDYPQFDLTGEEIAAAQGD